MDAFRDKFIEEAHEHIDDLERALLQLENNMESKELIEKAFRAMHSLKGGGAMFGFDKISEFTHNLENIYDHIRNGQLKITSELLTITLSSVDHLKRLLNEDKEDISSLLKDHNELLEKIETITQFLDDKSIDKNSIKDISETQKNSKGTKIKTFHVHFLPNQEIFDNGTNPLYLIDEISTLGECIALPFIKKIPDFEKIDPAKCYTSWEVFVATENDINAISDVFIFVEDECTLEINLLADENLLSKENFKQKVEESFLNQKELGHSEIAKLIDSTRQLDIGKEEKPEVVDKKTLTAKENTISSIRVSSDKLDQLMNLVSELVTTQARLSLIAEQDGRSELRAIAENVQKLTRQLRDNAFNIVLIPIENMLTRFQRLIRDLSKELKKDVDFITEGADTELDKTIIENLADPLMHILRNSMDHGIETADVRKKSGKPPKGQIMLKAYHSGTNVHIEVTDDGAGINPVEIRDKAIKKGIINKDVGLTQKEILDLIFLPGFSTAKNVTDVSGRGVGMDVVKRKISDIRGEVEVDSEVNKGTKLTIKLPLTLSIIDGLLIETDNIYYVIPLAAIDKIYAVKHNELAGKFNNVIVLDGMQYSFFSLRDEFKLSENEEDIDQVIVIKYDDKKVGLVVDNVVGEYQAVLKPLGKHYKKQDLISGATILGDGTIALVLDTNKAIRQFAKEDEKIMIDDLTKNM
ncbi:MAG: chemotaxis protein CheA [Bacteroidales bacterium]|nr:chemotaxis protein CheA [Bacteroidales bacterium]